MADSADNSAALDEFFRRWEASDMAERANYSMFLNELRDLLEVPRPDPAGPADEKNAYLFERAVPFPNPVGTTTVKRIDLYKRDCFVLEAKQGSDKAAKPDTFASARHSRLGRRDVRDEGAGRALRSQPSRVGTQSAIHRGEGNGVPVERADLLLPLALSLVGSSVHCP
jgi:hypothetical protein